VSSRGPPMSSRLTLPTLTLTLTLTLTPVSSAQELHSTTALAHVPSWLQHLLFLGWQRLLHIRPA